MVDEDYFDAIVAELRDLHAKKRAQYGSDTEPFGNFERASESIKKLLTVQGDKWRRMEAYALTLMSKQWDAVIDIIAEGKTELCEELEDKFRDLAVYSIICISMERNRNAKQV